MCLAFVLLLTGCTSGSPTSKAVVISYTPLQQAIIEAEKQHGLDSASTLRFSKPMLFTRRDSISGFMYQRDRILAYIAELQEGSTKEIATEATPSVTSDELRILSAKTAEYKQDLQRAQQRSPNQIVGCQVLHVYRINGRLDSMQFVVFNTSEVCRLEHVKHVEGKPDYSFRLLRDAVCSF